MEQYEAQSRTLAAVLIADVCNELNSVFPRQMAGRGRFLAV
jgi:hypothetical protein